LEAKNAELTQVINETTRDYVCANAELKQQKLIQTATLQRFQTLFDELPIPCFTVNEVGNIIEWNRACEGFFGLKQYQVIDRPISSVLGDDVYHGHAQECIYKVFLGQRPEPA